MRKKSNKTPLQKNPEGACTFHAVVARLGRFCPADSAKPLKPAQTSRAENQTAPNQPGCALSRLLSHPVYGAPNSSKVNSQGARTIARAKNPSTTCHVFK